MIGAALFWSNASQRDLYFSGTERLWKVAGAERKAPVNGGERLLSRARRLRTAEMFPPAEMPATIKPSSALQFNEDALSAAFPHCQQIFL
jgi:hypothetical protein